MILPNPNDLKLRELRQIIEVLYPVLSKWDETKVVACSWDSFGGTCNAEIMSHPDVIETINLSREEALDLVKRIFNQ